MVSHSFSRLKSKKIMVVGDLMLDTYTIGKVSRISPEAPVPVLRVIKEESKAGGAGNVILNLVTLGADVVCVGRIGADIYGQNLRESLENENAHVEGIFIDPAFKTPVKNRIIAANQQMVRIDHERIVPLSSGVEEKIKKYICDMIPQVQAIALSDYGKGLLTDDLVQMIIQKALEYHVIVVVDPKGINYKKYRGCFVIKPNLQEAYAAAGLGDDAPLEDVAKKILDEVQPRYLIITRSEKGMTLFDREGKRVDFSTRSKEVNDVTGAGDTVLSTLCYGLANHLDVRDAIELSNIAAGVAVECFGCARVGLSEIAERLLNFNSRHKIFDEGYVYVLKEALKGKSFNILKLFQNYLDQSLFKTLRDLRQLDPHTRIVLQIVHEDIDPDFVDLLSSLVEVDFVILQEETFNELTEELTPSCVWSYKDGKLHQGCIEAESLF